MCRQFAEPSGQAPDGASAERVCVIVMACRACRARARVYVRANAGPPGSRVPIPQPQASYWFSLGSVSSFEKKLEELGPEFARRVQAYKQVCGMCMCMRRSSLPATTFLTLFVVCFLLFAAGDR